MSMNISDYARKGQVFTGCTTASGLNTGLSTTATGLILYNPPGNTKEFLVYDATANATVVPGAVSVMMLSGPATTSPTIPTGTSAAAITNARGGGAGLPSSALLFTIITLPVVNVNLKTVQGGGVTVGSLVTPSWHSKLDGSLIVVPGAYLMFSYTTTAANCQFSFTWAEVNRG